MKNNSKRFAVIPALLLSLTLAGCSTVGDNTEEYFSQIGKKVSILTSSSKSNSSSSSAEEEEEVDDGKTALDSPGDLTIGEDGSYSFTGVDNADYYLLYMYDANSDSDTYTYLSSNIEEDGSGTYTGYLTDSITYAYGDYRIEAVAFPAVSDDVYKKSAASEATLYVSGEVSDPEISFVWSCFTEELDVIIDNIDDYTYTAYPTLVEVTLTNEADASDVVTTTLENLSADADTVAVTGVTLEETYSVSVSVSWNDNYVTNASASAEPGSVTVSATANAASDNYEYNSGLFNYLDYPLMAYSFDVTEGGDMGSWKIVSGTSWGATVSETAEYVNYTATPIDTEDGDLYTFSFAAANDNGEDLVTMTWGSVSEATGTLHIYEDGTFYIKGDCIFICTDQISSANQYHDANSIEGIWTDNGDGTINLAFDLSSEVDLGIEE